MGSIAQVRVLQTLNERVFDHVVPNLEVGGGILRSEPIAPNNNDVINIGRTADDGRHVVRREADRVNDDAAP